MDGGSNKSLFTLIAVVVFGIFLSLSYWMFQEELKNVLADVMDKTSETTSLKLSNEGGFATPDRYFEVKDNGDNTVTLLRYTGTSADLIIPSTINGKIVVGIADYFNEALDNTSATKIKTLTLPNTLTSIGVQAFRGNSLQTVVIPDSVTILGSTAFERNQLVSVQISKNIKVLNSWVFSGNYLKTVTIPEGVTKIDYYAFAWNQLTTITIPTSVNTLHKDFISFNPTILSINLPISLVIDETKITNSITFVGSTPVSSTYFDSAIVHRY